MPDNQVLQSQLGEGETLGTPVKAPLPSIEPVHGGLTGATDVDQSSARNIASALAAGYPVHTASGTIPSPTTPSQPWKLEEGETLGIPTTAAHKESPKEKTAYDIPLTSYSAATRAGVQAIGEETAGAAKSAVKSIWDTVATPPQDEKEQTANALGVGGLAIYRVLRSLGHSAGDATKMAGAIHDINQSSDPVAYYLDAARRTAAQASGQANVALATEGTAKIAGRVGPAYKNVAGKLSVKPLQEPLQQGIIDTVKQAVKDTRPEPAPAPDYVYRARDVGEQGVPKAHPQSHGQATSDIRTVDQYAGPGGRGEAAGEPKPQEVIRINRNRLKPEDYTEVPSKTDQASQTNFNRPLSEDEVEKWGPDERRADAAEKAKATETSAPETKSIRKIAEQAGDQVEGMAKSDYQLLDKESGGRIQRFRDKLEANRRKLMNLTDSEADRDTEASILKNQKETEDSMHDEFDALQKKGISPDLLKRADANFRKSQALYDLDNAIKKSTTGAHPDSSHPDLLKEYPETVDPNKLFNRINTLHDSGRLDDALGEAGADKLFDHTLESSGAYQKVLRNQKRAWNVTKGAAVLGGVGYAGYHLPNILGIGPGH
jgi:hypothetical protein